MSWNIFLRLPLLVGLFVAFARGQTEQPTIFESATSPAPLETPSETPSEGGLTSDQRAALWAGFVGGMVCIFGLGMLFYDMVVRKYSNQYRYARNVDMHVDNYKP